MPPNPLKMKGTCRRASLPPGSGRLGSFLRKVRLAQCTTSAERGAGCFGSKRRSQLRRAKGTGHRERACGLSLGLGLVVQRGTVGPIAGASAAGGRHAAARSQAPATGKGGKGRRATGDARHTGGWDRVPRNRPPSSVGWACSGGPPPCWACATPSAPLTGTDGCNHECDGLG